MANEQIVAENINANIAALKPKPVFADGTAIALRVKPFKNSKGSLEKECHMEIIFLDMVTQKPVGAFVISKNTAQELVAGLTQNLANLEKELNNKAMPAMPKANPGTKSDNSSYR